MAKSKFLPLQDLDGDKLIDTCKEVIKIEDPEYCPDCIPNPAAPVPNWRKRKLYEPFLNGKNCKYQITVPTEETTTGADFECTDGATEGVTEEEAKQALEEVFEKYEVVAITALLRYYNKDDSEESINIVSESIEHTDYWLSPRHKSRLKLLYSVPAEVIDGLGDALPGEDDEEVDPSDIVVTYVAKDMHETLLRVRKTLFLYNRYRVIFNKTRNIDILYVEDDPDAPPRPFPLQDFGDYGLDIGPPSVLGHLLGDLDAFLNDKKYYVPVWVPMGIFTGATAITEITFTFSPEYNLKKISFFTEDCDTIPVTFTDTDEKKELDALKDRHSGAWKDSTAMAYFAQMDDMQRDLEARSPLPWSDYVIKYTFPEVYLSDTITYTEVSPAALFGCIGETLGATGKQFGQDILDEVFSIGDAIAYKFHEYTCKDSLSAKINEDIELGLIINPNATLGEEQSNENLLGMAQEQQYQTIKTESPPFASFCERFETAGISIAEGSIEKQLDKMWTEAFDDIKLCGLYDAFVQAMTCLFSGLTFEDAIGSVTEGGLRGMSIANFGVLYDGIPADKQAEVDRLALEKLVSGDVFDDELVNQQISDAIIAGTELVRPWGYTADGVPVLDLSEEERKESSTYGTSDSDSQITYQSSRRTLAQRYDITSGAGQFNVRIAMEAYINAFLEVYSDDLLELLDELNKFPGAQLVALTTLIVDCPSTPFLNPGVMDFIHSTGLPNTFCRDIKDLTWPKLVNPFGWIPKLSDTLGALFEGFKAALQLAIMQILMQLLTKVCELIGDAICDALESGDLTSSLSSFNKDALKDMIKESICGEDADDEMVDDTIVSLISSSGAGGAAFADREQTIAFAEDIGASLTERELINAFLGNPSDTALTIVDTHLEYEHQSFRSALPHKTAIARFFKNIGAFLPADFKATLQDIVNQLPENDTTPANPTICADPELLERFCELRADLLCGRASEGQAREMCDSLQNQMKDDLGDLSSIMQNLDEHLKNNMPPLVSDPGCDNGLLPYEPEIITNAVAGSLGTDLEKLKVDFSVDMLGNGPMPADWGMLNMMLSDTMGNPLTTHIRNVQFKRDSLKPYVDFYGDWDMAPLEQMALAAIDPGQLGPLIPDMLSHQRGAFPTKVAAWLQNGIGDIKNSTHAKMEAINLNNDWKEDYSWIKTLEEIGMQGLYGGNLDLAALPDLGYNIEMEPVLRTEPYYNPATNVTWPPGSIEGVKFTEKGRKENPDITLRFSDNAKGMATWPVAPGGKGAASEYSYGFDIYSYFSDLIGSGSETIIPGHEIDRTVNRRDDNIRVKIEERFNLASHVGDLLFIYESPHIRATAETLEAHTGGALSISSFTGDDTQTMLEQDPPASEASSMVDAVITDLKYEFIAVDDTFDVIGEEFLSNYPDFLSSFESHNKTYEPQTVLLNEMLGVNLEKSQKFREDFIGNTLDTFFKTVADIGAKEESAWDYGANYDDLMTEDFMYGVIHPDNGSFVQYMEANQLINGADRPYYERDMVLGISFNQFKTIAEGGTMNDVRVLFLDPPTFGGNYLRPALHVRPLKPEGWLGVIDVFFPEASPCEPKNADLIDFEQIQKMMDDIYPNIPEDERLKSDPTCALELPYNRILQRPAKAGLVGLITAAIRLYVCAHFIKGFPTFTKFAPRCPGVFSTVYASYIIEVMEKQFKDAQAPFWELFNVFKDEEFWYAFLEQSVQMYAMLVDSGNIAEPPPAVLDALFRLNDLQADYEFPFKNDLQVAKDTGDAGTFQTLGGYRLDKNLEAVRATEEDAKIILKELVIEQMNFMADKFINNMGKLGWHPEVHDMTYYLLEKMTVDSGLTLNSAMNPDGSFTADYIDIGTVPDTEYYTYGGEFVVEEANEVDEENSPVREYGEEYVGDYHVISDDNGKLIWVTGAEHVDEPQDTLQPIVYKTSVPIGDVPELGAPSTKSADINQPFILEKYISINGQKKSPTTAYAEIRDPNLDLAQNISDIYPGTLKVVEDQSGNPVGLSGELGVRYGLLFSVVIEGAKYEVTSVELDALDLPLNEFSNFVSNSKLLLCLINHLKEDKKFKLISEYVFPLKKLVGLTAIYNDMGILPSIGELTVDKFKTFWSPLSPNPATAAGTFVRSIVSLFSDGTLFDTNSKPGLQIVLEKEDLLDENGNPVTQTVATQTLGSLGTGDPEYDEEEVPIQVVKSAVLQKLPDAPDGAWAHVRDRLPDTLFNPLAGFGIIEWDFWSQEILRKTRARVKRIFKSYYHSKGFSLDTNFGEFVSPGEMIKKELKAILKPAPGVRQIPYWMRGRLRTNPFDANGNVCEND